ncbi:MAG TPA: hypothetical protein VHA12_03470 [Candidatus Nanoarchaeia archaeon]|nr:hypothetical protein [Candidatus Nanoarchaeia archaeon]
MSVLPKLSKKASEELFRKKFGIKTVDELLFVGENTWQEFFFETRKSIKRGYGIDLTIIEQIHLRNIVKQCYDEQLRISRTANDGFFGFDVDSEAECRFIHQCYGLSYTDIQKLSGIYTRQEFKSYFRRMQERAHLP